MATDKSRHRPGKGLMVLDTPLLKVSRPVAACSRCRAAKIKCDGKLPACSACEKNGKQAECASANDHFARGKERSYVSTLETRIEKLERRLREAQQRKSSVVSITDEALEQVKDQSPRDIDTSKTTTTTTTATRAERRKEVREIDDLVSDFGYLSVNATARDYSNGFTAFMSYARLILSACSKDQLPVGMSTPLPPRHLASMAIQHYLDYTYTMLPFFEESALHYSIDAVYKTATDPYAGATAFDHWCVRMILGVTNAVLSEQRGDQYYMEAVGHVSVALSHSEQVLTPGSITNIQALLFLVEYAMVDPHHFDSWSLIGAASRAMVDLGLHQDPPKTSPMTRVKLELRRRIYYCVYMLDRSTSIVQTRTFSFSDDSAHVSVPFKDTGSPQASSNAQRWMRGLAPAVDLIKLRKLQSAWYHDLFQSGRETWIDPYAYLWQTYRTMSNWFANISPNYPAPVRSFFELELLYSYVYFLAPSPRVPNPCSYAQSLIFEHCIAYASLMTRLLNGRTHLPPVSFYDAMRVYMTGRQFLDVLSRSQEQLLAGIAPEPPPSGQNATTPPPLITRSSAASESNAARSITCIKQITDCLGHFGLRWGYMSWRDNFERVAEPLLNSLHQRRWSQELPNNSMPVAYRQGHLQHLSSGSVPTMDSLSRQSSSSLIQGSQNSGYTPLITGPQIKAAYNQTYGRSPYATESAGAYTTTVPRSSQQSPPMAAFSGPEYQFAAWQGMDGLGQYAGPRHSIQDDNIPPT